MPVARPQTSDSRVIAHVDMDCFYVQVEQRRQPHLKGQPTAVVQYNEWKGGGLIAVGYEARKFGVKRSMRGDEAKKVCPEIQLVQVPVARGKADLSIYRDAGSEVVSILAKKGPCERASIDEVYLDLTAAATKMLEESPPESQETINEEALKSHVLGHDTNGIDGKETVREWLCRSDADHRDKLLACGALIVAELRLEVLQETGFSCSAGVAHNKMLAKLASGMNKPSQQTVVPFSSVMGLLEPLPVKKMKQLGGKLGSSLQTDLGLNTVGDLLQFSEEKLQDLYGVNTGTWLWNIARGISGEEVQSRLLPKSHGSGKTFPGPRALKTVASVEQWLNGLCEELSERLQSDLEKNKRIAHTLTLHANAFKFTDTDSHRKFPSKSCPLRYGAAKIQEDAMNLFHAGLREYMGAYINPQGSQCSGWGITGLSVSASKIVAIPSGTCSITKYFHGQSRVPSTSEKLDAKCMPEAVHFSSEDELQGECSVEETPIKQDMPSLDHNEDERNVCEDEDLPCSLSKQIQDEFNGETLSLSSSGAENCSTQKETDLQFTGDGSRMKNANTAGGDINTTGGGRLRERSRKKIKEKGTTSILRFFQTQSSSSSSSANADHLMISQPGGSCSELVKSKQETLLVESGTSTSSQILSRVDCTRDAWNYKIDEIDPDVLNELPLEIQNEVRTWLRPQKRPNTEKQDSSIARYFLPKNTKRNS